MCLIQPCIDSPKRAGEVCTMPEIHQAPLDSGHVAKLLGSDVLSVFEL